MSEEDFIQKACEFLKGWVKKANKDIQEVCQNVVCPKIMINKEVLIRDFLKAMKQ